MTRVNEYGQTIGEDLSSWKIPLEPKPVTLKGRTCRLEAIDAAKHAAYLYAAYSQAADARDWTYLMINSFENIEQFRAYIEERIKDQGICTFAIIDLTSNKAVGMISLMNVVPEHGKLEVGRVVFSPLLKQSILSTETQFLLMQYVFDELGYRRYEWKCDNLNEPSRRAAARLGFTFEGLFRQAQVQKGRNRDTAWFSIIDEDWPQLKAAFQSWLAPANFNEEGRQIKSLTSFREKK